MTPTKPALSPKVYHEPVERKWHLIKFLTLTLPALLLTLNVAAQDTSLDNKMNDALRGGDKYYAVVAVLVTIFTILFAYLVYQDIRLKRIEKDLHSKSPKYNEQNRNA